MKLRVKLKSWDIFKNKVEDGGFWVTINNPENILSVNAEIHIGDFSRSIPPEKEYQYVSWPNVPGYLTIEEIHFHA